MIFTAYGSLGFLIGLLTGLANSPIAATVIAAILSFTGGTIAFVAKERKARIKLFLIAMASFSILACFGLFLGIAVKENKLLTNTARIKEISELSMSNRDAQKLLSRDYLKNSKLNKIEAITVKYRNKDLTGDDAFEALLEVINEK